MRPSAPVRDTWRGQPRPEPRRLARRILVVDDNRHHLEILRAVLEAGGHDVITQMSGAEALAMLAASRFDLVVLDMVMPEVNGLQVLGAMRAGGRNAQTPVFACTANYLLARRELSGCFGVAEIIAKPIDARQLLSAVERLAVAEAGDAA